MLAAYHEKVIMVNDQLPHLLLSINCKSDSPLQRFANGACCSHMSPGSCNCYANFLGSGIITFTELLLYVNLQAWTEFRVGGHWCWSESSSRTLNGSMDMAAVKREWLFLPFVILPPLLCWLFVGKGIWSAEREQKKVMESKIGQRTEIFRNQILVADWKVKPVCQR